MINEKMEIEKLLKSEHWQDNLSGLKWTPQLCKAIQLKHSHEVRIRRIEDQLPKLKGATLDDILQQRIDEQHVSDSTIAAVLKSKDNPRIMEVGFSDPDDMLLNNFGMWLASIIQPPSVGITGYTMYDTSNTARTSIYLDSTFFSSPAGFIFQFGAGTTTPARTNYQMQTPFLGSPEMNKFNVGSSSYAGNTISFANVITAGGSGTINEVGVFFQTWMWDSNSVQRVFLLIRDVLGTGISFVAGNPIVASCAMGI
jgi:hypothetical protein